MSLLAFMQFGFAVAACFFCLGLFAGAVDHFGKR